MIDQNRSKLLFRDGDTGNTIAGIMRPSIGYQRSLEYSVVVNVLVWHSAYSSQSWYNGTLFRVLLNTSSLIVMLDLHVNVLFNKTLNTTKDWHVARRYQSKPKKGICTYRPAPQIRCHITERIMTLPKWIYYIYHFHALAYSSRYQHNQSVHFLKHIKNMFFSVGKYSLWSSHLLSISLHPCWIIVAWQKKTKLF